MDKNEIDIEFKKLEERLKNIPKVTNRYMRMKLKRNLKSVFNLKWKYQS